MKKLIIVFLFLPFLSLAQQLDYFGAQSPRYFDSIKNELTKELPDSTRFMSMYFLSFAYTDYDPDSAFHYAQEAVQFEAKNREKLPLWMEWNGSNVLGWALWSLGNYPDAQEYYIKQLKQSEAIRDSFGMFQAYRNLGGLNRNEGNYQPAILYYKKCLQFYHKQEDIWWLVNYIPMIADLAKAYEQTDVLDSALYYTQKALQLSIKSFGNKSSFFAGYNLGVIYSKLGQPLLALDYFRSFLNGIKEDQKKTQARALCYYEMAKHFERNSLKDSAIYYAQRAFQLNQKHSFKINILNTSSLLSKLFQSSNQIDSAFKYMNIKIEIQESMFSKEKISRMQTLEFNEQIRQREIEISRQLDEHERNHNLQLIVLAISILTAIIIFLLLSQSIVVTNKFITFLGVVVLLVAFEFINLLLHPFIEKITNHSPILMLLILVCIAAIIVPFHHKIEKWATNTLVEKNKKIRLKAAKETIEKLEGKLDNNLRSE